MKLLNIGCGRRFHPDWINLDIFPAHSTVTKCDILNGIPYPQNFFDVVYHSHVLEHLEKKIAPLFINECCRVLKSGGILRVAVPDLEEIARQYLSELKKAINEEPGWKDNYDWVMLEMYDQVVRNSSGGQMEKFLNRETISNKKFIIRRCGTEVKELIEKFEYERAVRKGKNKKKKFTIPACQSINKRDNIREIYNKYREKLIKIILGNEYNALKVGRFRSSGENHLWMYDRFSLSRLLSQIGFINIVQRDAKESYIPDWLSYCLDIDLDGTIYKPDSLFLEALKP